MTKHICKSWPAYFQAIKRGDKTHDLRKMDRDFKVGDTILLQEYDPFTGKYTGQECTVEITYITSNETPCAFSSAVLENGYCILSLRVKIAPQKVAYDDGICAAILDTAKIKAVPMGPIGSMRIVDGKIYHD